MTTLPDWQPLTPESASLRLESDRVPGGLAGRVALAYVAWDGGRDWVAGFAVSLARNCSEKLPACLIDGSIEAGVLDGIARGLGRTEGVTDAVLFGASAQHITHDLGGALTFVPAGTPGADASEVLASSTWARLWDQAAGPGLGLVLVPVGQPGTERILEDAEAIILARPRDAQPSLPDSVARKTVAVVGPPVVEPPVAAPDHTPSVEEQSGPGPAGAPPETAEVAPAPSVEGSGPEEADATIDPWSADEKVEVEPALGGLDLSAPVDIDLDDIDELDVFEEAASADVTEEWLEPTPPAGKSSGSDAWSELGSALSLRESFQETSDSTEEEVEEEQPAAADGAPDVPGLVNPEVDALVKPEPSGPPPLAGEVEVEASEGAEASQPSVEALQALAKRTQRAAPEPRDLPVGRVALLVVLMALLFAVWMGWIPVPFTS